MSVLDHGILTGQARAGRGGAPGPGAVVVRADDAADLAAYRRLRHAVFVGEQALFGGHDGDDADDDPRTVVLVAKAPDGTVVGGVRLHPVTHPGTGSRDIGWWRGSRLVVAPAARRSSPAGGVGPALVRSACATAESLGALRFDALVQAQNEVLFARLGWEVRGRVVVHGREHLRVDWPLRRVQRLVDRTKSALGPLLAELAQAPFGCGGTGFVGDDGAPVPGTDVVAACDAILPAMVERDPEWAGWCAVLVNVNDLTAMGAAPVGLLDALGARDASFARRVLRGLTDAAAAWGLPVLGGHTQLGVPAALSVTALGRTAHPVPGGGARPGDVLRLTADLGGGWRPGYTGAQWDSTSHRSPADLRAMTGVVRALAPTAAKDVSMGGLVGTVGMLAEASGCRAVLDVTDVPVPDGATVADWFTCFPGFAMVSTEPAGAPDRTPALPDCVTTRVCGDLTDGVGVGLRWPDGEVTDAVRGAVTGMGTA